MDWGIQKNFIYKFSPDVLCTYARETFEFQKESGGLYSPAQDFLKSAVKELAELYFPGGVNWYYWKNLIGSIMFSQL